MGKVNNALRMLAILISGKSCKKRISINQQEESKKWLIINVGSINNKKVKKYMDSKGGIIERTIHPYGLYTYYGANYFLHLKWEDGDHVLLDFMKEWN